MTQYLSWARGRRDQGDVESLCLYVARFDPSAGTQVAHLPIECATVETLIECLNANPDVAAEVWRRLAESQGLKDTLTIERDEYKLAADTWQADALRDGAALEKVRKILGTTVVAEAVPVVLENTLRFLRNLNSPPPHPFSYDSGGSGELASAKPNDAGPRAPASTGPHAASREGSESAGSSCFHIDTDCDPPRPCRRKAGHSGPHSASLNEARRLDAVVTHEDLRKLRDEIWDELIAVCSAGVPCADPTFEEVPYLKLAQILQRARKS